jgi:hypothetical protein
MIETELGEPGGALRGAEVSTESWGRDLIVGWHAPWGPSLGRVVRGQSGDRSAGDVGAFLLGAPSPSAPRSAPRLAKLGASVVCAWIDAEGGAIALLDEPHEAVGSTPVTLLAPGGSRGCATISLGPRHALGETVRAVAITPAEGQRAWVAVATADGVRGGVIEAGGHAELDRTPWIARRGATPRLSLAEVRGQPILCAIVPGERELDVVRLHDGRPVLVTHRLERPVSQLAVEPAGSRLAVALVDSEAPRVLCAYVDARGKLTERPVAQIDRYAGEHVMSSIDGVSVVWVDDAFRLVARDAARRTAYVLPFLGPAGERVGVIPRVAGPPHARFLAPKLEVAAVAHDDDEGHLLVARTRIDGTEAAPLELRLAPPADVAKERAQARAHATCLELARVIAGASYRDTTLVAQATDDGARLEIPSVDQTIELRFLADREILVTLTTHGEGGALTVDESAFGKLARWARARLSREERTVAAREAAWSTRIAAALEGAHAVRRSEIRASSATGAVLAMVLSRVPQPEPLARWTTLVREELAAGRHREENVPRGG